MNILRLILSIIFAMILCFIPFFLAIGLESDPYTSSNKIINSIGLIFTTAAFIVLSGWLAQAPKKHASITAFLTCLAFTVLGIIRFAISNVTHYLVMLNSFGVLIGAAIGIEISYLVFKNKGWNSLS